MNKIKCVWYKCFGYYLLTIISYIWQYLYIRLFYFKIYYNIKMYQLVINIIHF